MQNLKKDVRFSCPLDCFDACSLVATVIDNQVSRIRGDRDHPLTRGACCIKGIKLFERLNHYLGGDFKKSQARARNRRTFSIARLAEYLETEGKPPIRCIFVSKANPLVQGPDINRTAAAFAAIDFKVVIDLFMTDTARGTDFVLPCTGVLEEQDIIHSSMFSPYVNYSGRAVLPPDGVMGEYEIFKALADRMRLPDYSRFGRRKFLE